MAKFHYSSYWHTWSRRLAESNKPLFCGIVEVNLGPIPGCFSSTWDYDVKPIRIRAHGTSSSRGDIDTDVLPESVKEAMVKNLGPELTERLLTYDFLPEIDWEKYNRLCNGGANFEDIKKG